MNTPDTIRFRRTPARYDVASRFFHWLCVLLLVAQFNIGWLMPDADSVKTPWGLVAWHIGIGTALLVIFSTRLIWVVMRKAPGPGEQRLVLRFLAVVVHGSMYALMLLVPVLGWLNADGRGWIVRLAGIWRLPEFATANSTAAALGEWHSTSAIVLSILIGLHVFAVFVHQVGFRDNLLRRML
ncbi:prokaryotic cytochrome b561 family protein [Paraburkholderia fungorum]|jgi:cytochrome b561|uniref:Cytochrome b/b6 domain-containing protein n=1 Tax=Paraburkholderia fungorum TaxID=134537 RepID=A0AAP5QGU1_9BURK|nr:cytochrome b/b6 domain-containing protein [Paraburkholderia fungorum]AJZ56660.1 prokaryotic cytochrome b561 family protein [Paraburkholderia fungorum]MDT8843443.1 cytochrome b/b6 domain-containing protein [Paraburkholderia fungorum]